MTNPQRAAGEEAVSVESLKNLDESRDSRVKILITASAGFFTDAYDLFIIGAVLTIVAHEWAITGLEKSAVSSVALLASFAGALVFGRLADRLGRKSVYGWEMLVLAAGALASAFAPNIYWLIALRAVLGFGIGGDYPVSATLMSEYAGKCTRGRLVALVFSAQGVGLVLGPLVAVALLGSGIRPDPAWRIMLAIGAIPAIAVFHLRRTIAETPRFRLAHQRMAQAEDRARRHGTATGVRAVLADRKLLRWLIGASLAWFLFDIAYYGNTIASSTSVEKVAPHANLIHSSLITLAIFSAFSLPFYYVAAFTIDRIGRRPMQVVGFLGMAAAFFVLFAVPAATSSLSLFIVFFGLTYTFAQFGPNTTTFVYPAEIFPVTARTTCHGIAAGAGKIGGFIGAAAMPFVVSHWTFPMAALLAAAVATVGATVSAWLLPEPKGQSLEAISDHSAIFEPAAV